MIQPYLILAAGAGIAGILFRRRHLDTIESRHQKEFDREQRKKSTAARGQNELRERLTLEEQSHKIQDSLAKVGLFLRKAELSFAREEWTETAKYLMQALALDEDNLKANRLLALVYLHQKDWRRAELVCYELIKAEPKEATHYGNLGLALYYREQYEESRQTYEQALTLDDKKASRWVSLGQVFTRLKDHPAAIAAFERATKLERRNTDYLSALAEAYLSAGDIEKASKTFQKILEITPYNEEVYARLTSLKSEK